MAFMDGIIVLGILGAFGFLIYTRLVKRNSPILRKGKELMKKKEKQDSIEEDIYETVHPTKRQIM